MVEVHVIEDKVVTCYPLGSFLEQMIFLVVRRVSVSRYLFL